MLAVKVVLFEFPNLVRQAPLDLFLLGNRPILQVYLLQLTVLRARYLLGLSGPFTDPLMVRYGAPEENLLCGTCPVPAWFQDGPRAVRDGTVIQLQWFRVVPDPWFCNVRSVGVPPLFLAGVMRFVLVTRWFFQKIFLFPYFPLIKTLAIKIYKKNNVNVKHQPSCFFPAYSPV
jgi:hypothetical protein